MNANSFIIVPALGFFHRTENNASLSFPLSVPSKLAFASECDPSVCRCSMRPNTPKASRGAETNVLFLPGLRLRCTTSFLVLTKMEHQSSRCETVWELSLVSRAAQTVRKGARIHASFSAQIDAAVSAQIDAASNADLNKKRQQWFRRWRPHKFGNPLLRGFLHCPPSLLRTFVQNSSTAPFLMRWVSLSKVSLSSINPLRRLRLNRRKGLIGDLFSIRSGRSR